MKTLFQTGDIKTYNTRVTEDKLAVFDAGMVHPVYSTFALGKDVEWACRLFVLEMKEAGEEGVGAYLSVEHIYPAPLHSEVCITATLVAIEKNKIICTWEAQANGHCIAKGEQVQRIIVKEKFDQLIASIAEKL